MLAEKREPEYTLANPFDFQIVKEKEESYGSDTVDYPFNIPTNPLIQNKTRTLKATAIIRTFFSDKIISSLDWLAKNTNPVSDSIPYVQKLLANLFDYIEQHYEDVFSSFLSALYDGLVFNDTWIKIKQEHYKKITEIVKALNNNPKLDYDKIDKAINELEKMGIDTTPY